MPTYTPPVTLAEFQTFINDASTEPTTLDFYTSLLETATEFVYTWLDRDYTPAAGKTDVFWGNDKPFHIPRYSVGEIIAWTYYDRDGNETIADESDLKIRENGKIILASTLSFDSRYEHWLIYKQPTTLAAPETVKQVIIELAYQLYESSKQGAGAMTPLTLSEAQEISLWRYRRVTT